MLRNVGSIVFFIDIYICRYLDLTYFNLTLDLFSGILGKIPLFRLLFSVDDGLDNTCHFRLGQFKEPGE